MSATEVCSLSRWERVGVRGYDLSLEQRPLTRIALQSDLSPKGTGELELADIAPLRQELVS